MIGVIFARESNRYDKTVYSLKSQVEACEGAAEAEGVEIAEVFREQFSGRDLAKMPKLGELRRFLQSTPGRKKVYCYAQDRLFRGRKGYHIFRVLSEFDEWETDVFFILDNVDTSSFHGQFQILFKGQKAATEVDDILDRTMRGKVKRIREGKIPGFGRNKYGYTRDKETGKATVNEAEAAVLRRICRALLAGESLNAIARQFNAEGVLSPFASKGEKASKVVKFAKWWPSAISRILRDPAYKGEGAALRGMVSNGRNAARPRQGWIDLPADCYPPILQPAEWERLQEILDKNRGALTRNKKHPALLRGLVFCARCGRPCYLTKNTHRGKQNLYYRCASVTQRLNDRSIPKCPGKQVAASWVEDEAWKGFVKKAAEPATVKEALARSLKDNGASGVEDEIQALRAELARRDTQETNLARELRDATPAVARTIKTELERIESERAALLARETEISRRHALAEQQRERRTAVEDEIGRAVKKLSRATFEQKRGFLEALDARVFIDGKDFSMWPFDEY
jgi:DNA invertase Pin-like site-specific DNA recombinase